MEENSSSNIKFVDIQIKGAKSLNTKMWNPVLFAVYNNKLDVVKFLLLDITGINKYLCLSQNEFQSEKQTVCENQTLEGSSLALMISISNKNVEMFDFLINDLFYLWTIKHLALVVKEIIHSNWSGGALKTLVNGKCFKKLFMDER